MNHPRMKPEMNRREYHLMAIDPNDMISGFTSQCIAKTSNIGVYINRTAKITKA
jgi:hypothetical protein